MSTATAPTTAKTTTTFRAGVVIVAHNREELIERAIRSVFAQTIDVHALTLTVVDAASTDDTASRIRETLADAPEGLDVRTVHEPSGRASAARNLGWRSTAADVIAFLDDDAVADPSWIARALDALDGSERIQALAGHTEIEWLGAPPPPVEANAAAMFTALDYGDTPCRLHYPRAPIGPNMIVRRSALERVGGFDPELGPGPDQRFVCEEGDLSLRIEQSGGEVHYRPDVRVAHLTPSARVTREYLHDRARIHGRSRAIVDQKHFGGGRAWRQLVRPVWRLLRHRSGLGLALDLAYAKAYFNQRRSSH